MIEPGGSGPIEVATPGAPVRRSQKADRHARDGRHLQLDKPLSAGAKLRNPGYGSSKEEDGLAIKFIKGRSHNGCA